MIVRLARKISTADVMGFVLFILSLQALTYGISASLRSTDTSNFFWVCLVAAMVSYGLGRFNRNSIQASAGIAALGIIYVWILGARLTQPLLNLGEAVLSIFPQIVPAVRFSQQIDTTSISDAWLIIAQSSSTLFVRLQSWMRGFNENITVNDALLRSMAWVFILWLCAAWMGWFAQKRNALASLLPAIALLALITSYSEIKLDSLWLMVMLMLLLMGIWNYRNHTHQWIKSRMDFSDSIRYDNGQAVLLLSIAIGGLAFITPSISWQDIMDYVREVRSNEAAEVLGVQEPFVPGRSVNVQKPSLPRDHLLSGGNANSEEHVMTIRTGELPPIATGSLPFSAPRYYWRSTIYDQYVGAGWVTSTTLSQNSSANSPLVPGLLNGYRVVHLDVNLIEPEGRLFWSGILFSVDIPLKINWRIKPTSDLFADQMTLLQSDMFAVSSDAIFYEADVYISTSTITELRSASTEYPKEILDHYFQLPRSVPARVHELAQEITTGITNPYDKARAIETYLRTNYPYDLDVPAPPEGQDVADYFLFDLQKGYCDYYATTMVVLARASGLPARFVSGYAPGSYDAPNAEYIVRELDAHSWVEIYFPGIGWIEFEPTASIAEIERAEDDLVLPEDQMANEDAASNLITQFRLERILIWSSPALGILFVTIIYFAFIERWLYLRLAPTLAIERIYQNFYRVGRPLAGKWEPAETSSEYLSKIMSTAITIKNQNRFVKLLDDLKVNASQLTVLYHSTLFAVHKTSSKDVRDAWKIWIRLRRQIYVTRFLLYISNSFVIRTNSLIHDQS